MLRSTGDVAIFTSMDVRLHEAKERSKPRVACRLAAITGTKTSPLVSANSPGSAMAANARPVCDLDQRNHAPADTGRDGDSLLAAVYEPISQCQVAGCRRRAR